MLMMMLNNVDGNISLSNLRGFGVPPKFFLFYLELAINLPQQSWVHLDRWELASDISAPINY